MPDHGVRLSPQDLQKALERNEDVVKYVDGLFEQNKQYFNSHNLSMLLVDEEGYVLKNYAPALLPAEHRGYPGHAGSGGGCGYLQHLCGTGPQCAVPDVRAGNVDPGQPFRGCLLGPPINVAGQSRYILSLFSLDQENLPYDILLSLLMTMKYSVENFLTMLAYWKVCGLISEDSGFRVLGEPGRQPALCQHQRPETAGRQPTAG